MYFFPFKLAAILQLYGLYRLILKGTEWLPAGVWNVSFYYDVYQFGYFR